MSDSTYWDQKHSKYILDEWIDKPTIFAKQVIKYFPNGAKVLELGAGQGQDSRFFVENGFEVVSTDFSVKALNLSKEKAQSKKIRYEVKELDISKPFPFNNFSFDVVYVHLSLHFWSKKETASILSEIARVIKKDGIFASLFNTIDDPEVKLSTKIEDNYYLTPSGIKKSFYTVDTVNAMTKDVFKLILLDALGETHKDSIKSLIRFVGKRKS